MSEQAQENRKYNIQSIEEIEAPEGMDSGQQWYQYVISHGPSRIEGKRPGTLESVKKHAEEYTENLNQRATLGYSAYATRKPKQEKAPAKPADNEEN
jgi:hypothetical protein